MTPALAAVASTAPGFSARALAVADRWSRRVRSGGGATRPLAACDVTRNRATRKTLIDDQTIPAPPSRTSDDRRARIPGRLQLACHRVAFILSKLTADPHGRHPWGCRSNTAPHPKAWGYAAAPHKLADEARKLRHVVLQELPSCFVPDLPSSLMRPRSNWIDASIESICGELQNARMLRRCCCATAVPIFPGDVPMKA